MSEKRGSEYSLVYFLMGNSFHQKNQYLRDLLQRIPDIQTDFGITQIDLDTSSLADIFSQAKTFPLGSNCQAISVKVNRKITGDEKNLLKEYFSDPPSFTVLILDVQNNFLERKDFQGFKHLSFFDSESQARNVQGYIARKIKERGKQISSDALELFFSKSSGESEQIYSYLDYLLLYVGERQEILKEDIEKIVPETLSYGSFDLVNALVSKKFDRVLEIFRDSIGEGSSLQDIMGLIHWQLKRLYEAKKMLLGGENRSNIGKKLRIGQYFLNDFLRHVERFELSKIEEAILQLVELDFSIKTGKVEGNIALEKYLIEMAS